MKSPGKLRAFAVLGVLLTWAIDASAMTATTRVDWSTFTLQVFDTDPLDGVVAELVLLPHESGGPDGYPLTQVHGWRGLENRSDTHVVDQLQGAAHGSWTEPDAMTYTGPGYAMHGEYDAAHLLVTNETTRGYGAVTIDRWKYFYLTAPGRVEARVDATAEALADPAEYVGVAGRVFGDSGIYASVFLQIIQVPYDPEAPIETLSEGSIQAHIGPSTIGHPTRVVAADTLESIALVPASRGFLVSVTTYGVADAIPEPSTWATLVSGLGLLTWASRRRRTRSSLSLSDRPRLR